VTSNARKRIWRLQSSDDVDLMSSDEPPEQLPAEQA
jgi:hypothetical protein